MKIIGLGWDEAAKDPGLGGKRESLATTAAKTLSRALMIAFESDTGNFIITDLGRIAAKYYIRYKSIEIFNEVFKPKMTEADVLGMLCRSTEVSCMSLRRILLLTRLSSLSKFNLGTTKAMSLTSSWVPYLVMSRFIYIVIFWFHAAY